MNTVQLSGVESTSWDYSAVRVSINNSSDGIYDASVTYLCVNATKATVLPVYRHRRVTETNGPTGPQAAAAARAGTVLVAEPWSGYDSDHDNTVHHEHGLIG